MGFKTTPVTFVRPVEGGEPQVVVARSAVWQGASSMAIEYRGQADTADTVVFVLAPDCGTIDVQEGDFAVKGEKAYNGLTSRALRLKLSDDGALSVVGIDDFSDAGTGLDHLKVRCV